MTQLVTDPASMSTATATDALAFLSPAARAAIETMIEETVARQLAERDPEPPAVSLYLSIPEAADLLRCDRQRIDDLLSSGRLTRIKEGGRTLVARAEIDKHLNDAGRGPAGRRPRCSRT